MLAYAFLMTLIVGIFIGIAGTVAVAIKLQERDRRKAMQMHPSFTDRIRSAIMDN